MAIELYPHNQAAYEAAVVMLAETGKAAVIHPTGTGKSFIGFKLSEDFPDRTVCWLSPSEYIFQTQLDNIKAASGSFEPRNIRFFTYARLMTLDRAEMAAIMPDFIILDEFHRCGAKMWGQGVRRLLGMYPGAQVLGLSATNIRYLDNQRDMADELFDGNVASEMTLGEAVVRGILSPPRYVLSAFSCRKDLERYEKRAKRVKNRAVRDAAERYLDALRRALELADGLDAVFDKHMAERTGKYIVFCANKGHMDAMIKRAGEWFARVDKAPRIYSVYSEDPAASEAFAAFKEDGGSDHLRLLYCIDALNEGIHVEGVSGVILLRPTVSPIIYKQQIGRALSAGKSGVPVIFDVVMNIDNLYSIGSFEEELRAAADSFRALGAEEEIVNERFRVVDELRDCRELFEKLNDTLTAPWEAMYGYAKRYFEAHGDLDVPQKYKTPEGYSLGEWLATQRRVYHGKCAGNLSREQIERLDGIGMRWDSVSARAWNRYYGAARRYFADRGDLLVPAGYVTEEGVALGRWIANLRIYRRSGVRCRYLTRERTAALDALGMVWNVLEYQWEVNYRAAERYYRQHGDLDMPAGYVDGDGVRLGTWLDNMRNAYAKRGKSRITPEQAARLEALGIQWDKRFHRLWETGCAAAKAYFEKNGRLDVPSGYRTDAGFRLGGWISDQREKYRAGKLTKEQIARLDAIGMIWRKDDPWETRFALAEAYYREHGDLNVPGDCTMGGVCLAKWVNEQKQAYRGNRKQGLTDEQTRRLESIGMDWRNLSEAIWEARYEAVKDYFDGHGNIDIPKDAVLSNGRSIGNWITVQRANYRKGKLTGEQIAKLDAVGMVWEKRPGRRTAGTGERKMVYAV